MCVFLFLWLKHTHSFPVATLVKFSNFSEKLCSISVCSCLHVYDRQTWSRCYTLMAWFKDLNYHMHTINAFTHFCICSNTHYAHKTSTHKHTPAHTQTFANDLLPTFHHSSLESSVTCTRSPGLEEIRQERRWTKGGTKGGMIEVGRKSAWRIRCEWDGEMKWFRERERVANNERKKKKKSRVQARKITLSNCDTKLSYPQLQSCGG